MKHRILPFLLAPLFLGACTHYYYAPNSLQTPFLQQQHDTRASLALVSGDQFSGFEGHASYSPVNHMALMVNHFNVRHARSSYDPNEHWGKGHLTELALGAYLPSNITCVSLFGGWGRGRVLNSYDEGAQADLRFERLFIQPGLAVQGKWARLGLAFRFNRLKYVDGAVDLAIDFDDLETIEKIEKNSPIGFAEFGFSFGFGTRPIWVDFKINSLQKRAPSELGFAKSSFALTVQIDLDYYWRKEDTEPGGG